MEKNTFLKVCMFCFILMYFSSGVTYAQKLTVSKTVSDTAPGKGIPGVNVVLDETSDYIISSMQLGKGSTNELSDDIENRTTAYIKKLNQSIGYKPNDSDITTKNN